MTLSDLILEYVDASKRADRLVSHLEEISGSHAGRLSWQDNQRCIELCETFREYGKAFHVHGLHSVALECALTEARMNKIRFRL